MRYQSLVPLIAAIPSVLATPPPRPEIQNSTTLPTHFAMMLIPEFQALDVFGPLDVLNTLAMMYKNNTKMQLPTGRARGTLAKTYSQRRPSRTSLVAVASVRPPVQRTGLHKKSQAALITTTAYLEARAVVTARALPSRRNNRLLPAAMALQRAQTAATARVT
jgi:hypothetical protein